MLTDFEIDKSVDADIDYAKENEVANLAQRICAGCFHYDAWHTMAYGCEYRIDRKICDCDEFKTTKDESL